MMDLDPIFWTIAGSIGTAVLGLGVWSIQQAVSERRAIKRAKAAEAEAAIKAHQAAGLLDRASAEAERVATRGDSQLRDMLIVRVDGLLAQQRELALAIKAHADADLEALGELRATMAMVTERQAHTAGRIESFERRFDAEIKRRHDQGDALQLSLNAIYEKLGMIK